MRECDNFGNYGGKKVYEGVGVSKRCVRAFEEDFNAFGFGSV